MYLRYIYKLHALHVSADNFTEAGFTLKLYADSLSWTNAPLTSDPLAQPGQTEWQRKEELYHQIIRYFDKGKVGEFGVISNMQRTDILIYYDSYINVSFGKYTHKFMCCFYIN